MRKTFGSAFALILVALFAVAPTSPATATPEHFGGIHLHLAGKAGQKAVGSTIIFGAEGLKGVPQDQNSCLSISRSKPGYGDGYALSPIPATWDQQCPKHSPRPLVGKPFQIPPSGSFVEHVPLPDLPPGSYQLWFGAIADYAPGTGDPLTAVFFDIEADGSFSKVCNSMKNYGTPEFCRSQ